MKLIKADWIVIVAFCLLIISHSATNFIFTYYKNVADTIGEANKVVNVLEANPIAQWVFMFNNLRLLFQFVVMPVWFFGIYYYTRKKFINLNPELLETIAVMCFMIALLHSSNDISILLGLLAK